MFLNSYPFSFKKLITSGNVSYVKILSPASCIKITTEGLLPTVFFIFCISSSFVLAPAESFDNAFQSR